MYNIEIENPKNIEMYQYDKGNKIIFDKDIEDLTQIHYECEGETDTQLIENNQALVPYSMTKIGKSIQCYFYVITATGERTKFNFTILIKPRPEPNKEISEEEEKTFLIEVKEIFQKIEEKVKVNDKTLNEIEQVKKQANEDLIKTKEDGMNALITAKDDYLKILDNQKVIILGDIDSHKAVVLMDISNMGTSALNNIARREGVAIGNMADLEALVQGNINTNANQHLQNIKDEANSKIAIIQELLGKISIMEVVKVEELPSEDISTKTLYLLPNGSDEENNSCDEYINLDGTVEGWEKVGSTQVDLKGYVKNTDVAGINKLGLVQIPCNGGLGVSANGGITIDRATAAEIKALSNQYKTIVPANLKMAVETIGGALDELQTDDKTSYTSALNELASVLADKADKNEWELFNTYTANGETGGFEYTTASGIKAKEIMIVGRGLTFSGGANMNLGFRTSANPHSSGHRQLVFANGLTADNTYQIRGVIKRIGTDEILVSLELWRGQSVSTVNVAKRQFIFKDTELFAGKNIVYISNTVSSGNKINTGTIETYVRGRY